MLASGPAKSLRTPGSSPPLAAMLLSVATLGASPATEANCDTSATSGVSGKTLLKLRALDIPFLETEVSPQEDPKGTPLVRRNYRPGSCPYRNPRRHQRCSLGGCCL